MLNGGTGDDTASYAASSTGVNIDLSMNTATGGDATGDTLNSIENLIGSGAAATLTGANGSNIISGGAKGIGRGIARVFARQGA